MGKHICFLSSAFSRDDSLIIHRQGKSLVAAGYKVTCLFRDGVPTEHLYGMEMRSVGQTSRIESRATARCSRHT